MIAAAEREAPPDRGAVAATVAAAVAAAGAMVAVAGLVAVAGPDRRTQTIAFVAAFAILLPLAVALGRRSLARRPPLDAAAAVGAGALLVALLGVLWIGGEAGVPARVLRGAAIAGGAGLAAVATLLAAGPESFPLRRLRAPAGLLPPAAAGLGCLAILLFVPGVAGVAAVLVAALAAIAAARLAPRLRGTAMPRGLRVALDCGLLLLVLLLSLDLTGYWGPDLDGVTKGLAAGAVGPVSQVHQNFYLGPVTDVLHGRALLVESDSVYGIGVAYAIAGWFKLAPIGYGTFSLLGSLVSALMIAAGWLVLRLARVPFWLRAAAVALGLVVCVLAPLTPPTLFLNIGGLRFAPPLILIAAMLPAARRGAPASWSPAAAVVLALASIWSTESLVYCAGAWVAVVLAEMLGGATVPARRLLGRAVVTALAALAAVHVCFALLTLAFSGELPDWGMYVSLFREWSRIVGDFFDIPAQPWSPVWVVGAVYLLSGLGLGIALAARPGAVSHERAVAIAGLLGAGAASLTYFLAHPIDLYLPEIAYPAILLGALWTAVALGPEGAGSAEPWRRAALAVAAFAGVLVLAGAWPGVRDKLPRTAVAHLVPGGPSFADDWSSMWDSPPIDPRAVAAQALIERNIPGDEALVLTEPDLGMEALMRSGRANVLPSSYPPNDEVDLPRSLPPVEDAVAGLEPGTLMLTQAPPGPGEAPSKALEYQQLYGQTPAGSRLGPLAQAALDRIEERFRLVPVAKGPDGLAVVRLESR